MQAYKLHSAFLDALESHFKKPIHPTLLTNSEEAGTNFIERTCAIKLDSFFINKGIQFNHFYQMLPG